MWLIEKEKRIKEKPFSNFIYTLALLGVRQQFYQMCDYFYVSINLNSARLKIHPKIIFENLTCFIKEEIQK